MSLFINLRFDGMDESTAALFRGPSNQDDRNPLKKSYDPRFFVAENVALAGAWRQAVDDDI